MTSKKFLIKQNAVPAIPEQVYRKLLQTLNDEIREGLENITRFVRMQKVITHWNMGRAMADLFSRYGVHQALYDRISKDTGMHVRTLQQCVQFVHTFPKIDFNLPLSWSHYRYLMMVESDKERERWQRRILRENLESNVLHRLIIEARLAAAPVSAADTASASSNIQRGQLYTYRIIKVDYVQDAPQGFVVDCGFEIRIPPPKVTGEIDNSRIVESRKSPQGYFLKLSKATTAAIFTYKAIVERVIDGDTLLVNIDCGFTIWNRQRLRFRGVDAPEVRTQAGERTVRWLKEELSQCPFVIIKTYKTDKYDRYLVDVFYRPGVADPDLVAREGELLNLKMLNLGLVQKWQ